MTTAKVIDISSWQHPNKAPIDFEAVYNSGVRGVMCKATQDTNYANPYFAQDYEAAHAAGLMFGAYHFCVYGSSSPEAQAKFFLANTQGIDLELGRSADCEEPFTLVGLELTTWVEAFLAAIDQPDCFASLYTNGDGMSRFGSVASTYRLWGALLNAEQWPNQWMSQTGTEEVPGVQGACDVDVLNNIRNVNPPDGGGGVVIPPALPAPAPGPTTEVYAMHELAEGATGIQVKTLQFILKDEYGTWLTIDGQFGPQTKAAVTAMQLAAGVAGDGIVGPVTWAKLLD